ncbi:MAG TPA: hypothetical protein VM056_02460 [Terriglobales bacterium]|nr:hypothetical protein [Terriglobales bacterium]
MRLEKLVGQTIFAKIPQFNPEIPVLYKLLEIEHGGLWLESQDLLNEFLEVAQRQASPRTLTIFVPLSQVGYIFGSEDYPALSEKAFGLKQ